MLQLLLRRHNLNSDFAAYLDNLKKQIKSFDANLTITEKKLQYGIQLTVTNSDSKVVLSVYNGKKGIKFVWGGTASELRSQLEAVLTGKDTADKGDIVQAIGNDYTLLRNCADFKGIWAGSDESGKGDFFGPLVVAAVLVDITTAEILVRLAELIVEAAPINTVLALKPEMYNFRYQQMRADGKNLNHLLSNGHIAVLRNVLRQCPQCNYALVDQFTASNDIRASLQQEFPDVNIVQQHRAEADIAVAAASVLARAKFLEIMQELAEQVGRNELPKGGSDAATNCARELLKELGRGALERLVKVHFANYKKS